MIGVKVGQHITQNMLENRFLSIYYSLITTSSIYKY